MYRQFRRITVGIAIALTAGLVGLQAQNAKPATAVDRVVLVELFTSEAVSYTHLDVYKRQVYDRLPLPKTGGILVPKIVAERRRLREAEPLQVN